MTQAARNLLARVLDEPGLVATVQSLEPSVLGALVERIGVEDSGELVAMATTEQLVHLFDESLWESDAPGDDERFDPARFATWLEVMLETGDAFVAQRITELPEELVFLAFHDQILVLDADALGAEMADMDPDDAELTEKALDASLVEELGDYLLVSRRHDGWDAVLSVLMALDRDHHDYLQRLLERCCHASTEHIEDQGGLYDVLTSAEMLESDAAAEREDRRARRGFVSPASARAFLELARTTAVEDILGEEPDPIVRAYFRELDGGPLSARRRADAAAAEGADAGRLFGILRDAGVVEEARPTLPASGERDVFRGAMVALLARDPDVHARRLEELAFLSNVLLAGPGIDGRRYRSVEAVETVVALCTEGLGHLLGADATTDRVVDALRRHRADTLFRVGWRLSAARTG